MKTVLYIEERKHIRDNFIKLLSGQEAFFKLLTVDKVVEAMDVIEKIKIDVVIAGRKMAPNEIDFLDNCLRNQPECKLIAMTGRKSQVANILKAFEYNIHFETPVDMDLFLNTLFEEFGIESGGQLRGISIASFLQMIELEAITCRIKAVSKNKTGYLYCDQGEPVHAEMADLKGKEAAFAIMALETPLIIID